MLLVWVLRLLTPALAAVAAAVAVPVWLGGSWVIAAVAGAVAATGSAFWAFESLPGDLPGHGVHDRYELARRPSWDPHTRIAERLARRSPARAERLLRIGYEQGSPSAYWPLTRLLSPPESDRLRADLLRDGSAEFLRDVVALRGLQSPPDAAEVLELQKAVVARLPGDPDERDRLGALLAESGANGEAWAAHTQADRLRAAAGLRPGTETARFRRYTADCLSRAGRGDEAKALLSTVRYSDGG
ncbi:hypothetical protein AB0M02_43960 [Actinoplanes sp. NPDC051861]|uniref:hypothetical protein n=1 Tax=Actinoplanes sp. NPDC051861 TaxID=3155170 RepID=UPI003415EC26